VTLHGDHRDYTDEEKRQLTLNLEGVALEIHQGDWISAPVSVANLCTLHRRVFGGVREHAGRHRNEGWGAERLTFGPNRSTLRNQVAAELERAFDQARRSIASIHDNPNAPECEAASVQVAVWLHAEIVRIHPFEDGNGRTSRLIMAQVLVQLGLRPIPIEAVKQEYSAALNHYFRTRQIQLLVDLFLRLADAQ